MINSIGFKGYYRIIPPGYNDTGKSPKENMDRLKSSLEATCSANVSQKKNITISIKENGVFLDTGNDTNFSEDDKWFLRTAIYCFAGLINMKRNPQEGETSYREKLRSHLENELEKRKEITLEIPEGTEKLPSTINLNLKSDNVVSLSSSKTPIDLRPGREHTTVATENNVVNFEEIRARKK